MAVQTVRHLGYQFTQGAVSNCWVSSAPSIVINGVSITVDCEQAAYNPGLSRTRVIDFYACSTSGAPCTNTNALVYANVTFDDYPTNGGPSLCVLREVTHRRAEHRRASAPGWSRRATMPDTSRIRSGWAGVGTAERQG